MRRLTAVQWMMGGATLALLAAGTRGAGAQSGVAAGRWNDSRSRALVELATKRRAEQLADTGLVDYRASARGYVTFLAQFGEGFLETPKLVKTDQLALEVYWHAPNMSKQRIIGRRDTLLLPTDIQYHRDHLGIVQNNFPAFIRLGEGDEVRDVPHPLSPAGLALYDYQISDSIRIRAGGGEPLDLIEVKVRPKDDRFPRVVGAVYLDPTGGQVVRMAFNFTRAAFRDAQLEDLAIVLENRLVSGRFWLPSRQEIEIRRTGTWLDYPVRGIIRGRWEIGEYAFNLALPTQMFAGPEIVPGTPEQMKAFAWEGTIMEALPPDVAATVDPDIQRVQAEARLLVRAQALARVQTLRLSARRVSDFIRMNRAEGLAVGSGFSLRLFSGVSFMGRGRFGYDDHRFKGSAAVRWDRPSGSRLELSASHDLGEIGDETERSSLANTIAAQEFASDLTDPYGVSQWGARGIKRIGRFELGLSARREEHRQLRLTSSSHTGTFRPIPEVTRLGGVRLAITGDRSLSEWIGPGRLGFSSELGLLRLDKRSGFDSGIAPLHPSTVRGTIGMEHRSTRGDFTLVVTERASGVFGDEPLPLQQLVYFGGPTSLPGYNQHDVAGQFGSATRIELQVPVPFPSIRLGRFGRVPGRAHLAPHLSAAVVGGSVMCTATIGRCPTLTEGFYPAVGVGLLTFFDVLRFDVARGLKDGRWIFNVDVHRDFWSIL